MRPARRRQQLRPLARHRRPPAQTRRPHRLVVALVFVAMMLLLRSINAGALLNPGPTPPPFQSPPVPASEASPPVTFTVQSWNAQGLFDRLDEAKSLVSRVRCGITFIIDHKLSKRETRYGCVRNILTGHGTDRAALHFTSLSHAVPQQARRGVCAIVSPNLKHLCSRVDAPARLEGSALTLDVRRSPGGAVAVRVIAVYVRPWQKKDAQRLRSYIKTQAALCRKFQRRGEASYSLLIVGDFNATFYPADRPGDRFLENDAPWRSFCRHDACIRPILMGTRADGSSQYSFTAHRTVHVHTASHSLIDNCYLSQADFSRLAPQGRVDTQFEHSSDHNPVVFEFALPAVLGCAQPPAAPVPHQPAARAAPTKAIKTPIKPALLHAFPERCARALLPDIQSCHEAVRQAAAAWEAATDSTARCRAYGLLTEAFERLTALDDALFRVAAQTMPHTDGPQPAAPAQARLAGDRFLPRGVAAKRARMRHIITRCRRALRFWARPAEIGRAHV